MYHHKLPDYHCPYCNQLMNGTLSTDGKPQPPQPGDLSCCFRCGGALQFDANLKPSLLCADDWNALTDEMRDALVEMSESIKGAHHD